MNNLTIFDFLYQEFKSDKKIRLIELFAGYGSQNLALKYLGANYEHYKICEWATKSIQAYNDLHIQDYTDYSKNISKDEVISYLFNKGISLDYNKPMNLQEIKRKGESWQRQVYNNIIATNNLVNIQQVKGSDLEIVDTDTYDYLMTYSFPCQDLSLAGKQKGMADTSTRSGMLWEVERILDECYKLGSLPQILLMENVTQVVGTKNIKHFQKWRKKLEDLGYQSYVQNMIATEYGIPQTRDRTFMLSVLGEYNYTFPNKMQLKYRLKNLLENDVDESYYLTSKQIKDIQKWGSQQNPFETLGKEICPTLTTRSGAYAAGMVLTTDGDANQEKKIKKILIPEATKKGYAEAHEGDGVYLDRPHQKRGVVQKGMIQTLKTSGNDVGVVVGTYQYSKSDNFMKGKDRLRLGKDIADTLQTSPKEGVAIQVNLKQQLCNSLIENGLVQENDVIRHSYSNSRMENWDKRNIEFNNLVPTLDTRCDCLGVVVNNNNIYDLFFAIFDLCCIIDTKEKNRYERSRELLQVLWQEIGKKEIWQEIRRFISIQKKEILQQGMYEKSILENWKQQPKISASTPNSREYNEEFSNREKMFNMWEDWKIRYTPQRWELSEQQFREFNLFMQELSYETTSKEESMCNMWETNERFRILRETLSKIQEIWKPTGNKIQNGLRIRKLTPREVFRLMGVKDEDFENIAKNQSNSSLYHLAGDSIVTSVLMAIFGKLLGIDYETKINELLKELVNEDRLP